MKVTKKKMKKIRFEDTELYTWDERDSAFIELRDKKTQKTLVEWWDEEVKEVYEDGFLDPQNLHESVYDYYKEYIQ